MLITKTAYQGSKALRNPWPHLNATIIDEMTNTGNQYGRTWRSYDINFDFEQTQRALKKHKITLTEC